MGEMVATHTHSLNVFLWARVQEWLSRVSPAQGLPWGAAGVVRAGLLKVWWRLGVGFSAAHPRDQQVGAGCWPFGLREPLSGAVTAGVF